MALLPSVPSTPTTSAITAAPLRTTLGFAGSREKLRDKQIGELRRLIADPSVETVHHGGCIGGDEMCHQFALYVGKTVVVHPPHKSLIRGYCGPAVWSKSKVVTTNGKDFLLRIDDIIAACDILIVCPETVKEKRGSRAWYAIRRAKRSGKTVKIILPPDDDDVGE